MFWHAFAEVPEAFAWFVDLVVRFKPDILEFEEPYLWPIVRGYVTEDSCAEDV